MNDIHFLTKLLIGIAVSVLLFAAVELLMRIMNIHDHRQRSHLYLIALLSSFSSIGYTFFLFGIHIRGDELILAFPNVMANLTHLFMKELLHTRGGFDVRVIFFILMVVSLSVFIFTLFFSKFYMKRVFEPCEDKNVLGLIRRMCCESKVEMPKVMMTKGINAFVFGVPPVLAVGRELVEKTSEKELELILKHEVNHIKNHDNILKPFLFSLRILFFFNPVVHILSQNLTREREFLADKVSEIKKEKVLFLHALVRLSEIHIGKDNMVPSVSFTFGRSNLKARTDTLLCETRRSGTRPYFVFLYIFTILIIAGMYVSSNPVGFGGMVPVETALHGKAPERIGVPHYQIDNSNAHAVISLPRIVGKDVESVFTSDVRWGSPPDVPSSRIVRGAPFMFYSVDAKTVIITLLILPLLFEFSYYVINHNDRISRRR